MIINLGDNELPKQWEITKLPDFTNVVMGQSPLSETYNLDKDGLPFFQGKTEFGAIYPKINKYCSKPNKIAEEGATLLSVRAPVGPTNLAKTRCCIGRGLAAIHPIGGVDPKFIFLLLRSIELNLAGEGTGSTFKAITKAYVDELTFAVPPLNEQKRIVAKIEELFSELDNGIAALKTAREQLKVYRQSVLKHAFEGKLTAKWREENADKLETPEQLLTRIQQERDTRYQRQLEEWKAAIEGWEAKGKEGKKPGKPKKSAQLKNVVEADCVDYPTLPAGWSYVRLGMLMDEPAYGTSAKCEYESGEQGVLRIPNMINGAINDSDLKFASFEKGEVDHLRLAEGDILTIRSNGSISLVGSCALINKKDTQHIFAGYLIRLRLNPSLVLSSFLLSVMSSHLLRKQIEAAAKSTSGVNNINSGELQNLIIPLPSVDEQRNLLIHMDALTPSVNATEGELVNQLKKAETLRQSILKKAFSGKLVPQDPNDEPASELLARIKTEKAVLVTNKTANKKQEKQGCQP